MVHVKKILQIALATVLVVAPLPSLSVDAQAALIEWDDGATPGDANGRWRSNSWVIDGGPARTNSPPAGSDIRFGLLPGGGTGPFPQIIRQDDASAPVFNSIIATGGNYTLVKQRSINVAGQFGTTGSGQLAIQGDLEGFDGISIVGNISMDRDNKRFRLNDAVNGIGGGGTIQLGAGHRIEGKVDNDSVNSMDFTVSLADGATGKLDNKKNVTGGVANGVIHWTDVLIGNGATLVVDADKQADIQLDVTLLGSTAILDADSHRELGRSSQIRFGDLVTSVQDTTLVLDVNRRDGSDASATFVGMVSPGASPGTLTLDPINGSDEVVFASTGLYDWELGLTADLIHVLGDLTVEDGFSVELTALAGAASGSYDLFTYTGTFTGDLNAWNVTNPDGRITYDAILDTGSSIQLLNAAVSVIPEPTAALLMGLAFISLVMIRPRRRRYSRACSAARPSVQSVRQPDRFA